MRSRTAPTSHSEDTGLRCGSILSKCHESCDHSGARTWQIQATAFCSCITAVGDTAVGIDEHIPLQYAEVWPGLTSAAHMRRFAPAINAPAEENSSKPGSHEAARVSRPKTVAATRGLRAAASASDWAARNTQSGTGVGMLDVQLAGTPPLRCGHHCSTGIGAPLRSSHSDAQVDVLYTRHSSMPAMQAWRCKIEWHTSTLCDALRAVAAATPPPSGNESRRARESWRGCTLTPLL